MAQAFADSLDYFDGLLKAGVPEDQARVHVKILRQNNDAQYQLGLKEIYNFDRILRAELATKNDFQDLREELQSFKVEVSKEFQSVREDFSREIQSVRGEIQAVREELQSFKAEVSKEFQSVREDFSREIQSVRGEIQSVRCEIQAVREDLSREIQGVKDIVQLTRLETQKSWNSLIRWGVTAMIAQTALLVAIIAAGMNYLAK